MMNNVLLPPADDTASRALIDVQTATTRVKEIITECVSKGVNESETTARLNKAIASACKRIANTKLREETRKALVSAARKWHYQLKQTYRVLDYNLRQEVRGKRFDIDMDALLNKPPVKRDIEFRKILDDGTTPAAPVIRDYERSVKIAMKALSAEPAKVVERKDGKTYVMPLRNRAETAVRYDANVKSLQELISAGYAFAWTSSHPNCSPRCKDLQGRLWSLHGETGTVDGIHYDPIDVALKGPNEDGNGIISGYNCRHRLIGYVKGSKAPTDYTEAEIKREYAVDKQQRSYENRIRQMKTEERLLRAAGKDKEASALRKDWRKLTLDYEIYSEKHNRPFYRYRCIIDEAELDEADINEYVSMRNTIGEKNVPKTLEEFKEMKYNDSEEYRLLQHYRYSRTQGNISALASFELFKQTKNEIEKIAIGKTVSNGVKIKQVSLHFVDRAIGTIYTKKNKHEGLSVEDIQNILLNGMPTPKRKNADGSISQTLSLDGIGRISINLTTGVLIQCNKTNL